MPISQADRERLRDTARRQAELAHSPENQRLYADWLAYGAGEPSRPLLRVEIETFEEDILPALQTCQGEEARAIERRMLRRIANFTLFHDDTLVPDHYAVCEHTRFVPFGLPVRRQETGGVGHHFVPYLHDLEADMALLGPSVYAVDEAAAEEERVKAEELFGDILPVRREGSPLYCCPMQDIIHIMNMDDLYMAMIDGEDNFRAVLGRLVDDYIAAFRQRESLGTLRGAARDQGLAQGTYCFTTELPDGLPDAKLSQVWLYMDAQEASGISPKMYEELVFPAYRKLMELCGLVSYGCCEATHPIWEGALSKLPNLRKVSISPWCDEAFMGEALRGTGITYLRKPPATLLGMDGPLDEDAVTACFRKTARAARGCRLEVAQRDVYRVGSAEKVRRYVELARRALEE